MTKTHLLALSLRKKSKQQIYRSLMVFSRQIFSQLFYLFYVISSDMMELVTNEFNFKNRTQNFFPCLEKFSTHAFNSLK